MIVYYWGEGGLYGPFNTQEDGWPNTGQVVRYFRKKAKFSARVLGQLYGNKVSGDRSPVTERWIIEMELENKVPTDMTRRRALAELLNIPFALLGLATLEDVTLQPEPHATMTTTGTVLKRVATDTTKYQSSIRFRWKLHATSNAEDTISEIDADLLDLGNLANQGKGDFLYHVNELAFSNYVLAADIVSLINQHSRALYYANEAVRVAKAMNDPELVASALYTRGCHRLFWGLYGAVDNKGFFVINKKHLEAAARDFESAKKEAHPQLKGLILTQLSRSQAHLQLSNTALLNLDDAAKLLGEGIGIIEDAYTRTLITGTFTGFHQGRYLTERAITLNATGRPGEALKTIQKFKKLEVNTYGKDETRRFAWIDTIASDSYLKMGEYPEATKLSKSVVGVFKDINCIGNISIVKDIHSRLLTSSYGKSEDVKGLGEILEE